MAKFSFSKFNKERLFNVDTSEYDYLKLEDLYARDGEGAVYPVLGVYIGTKSKFDAETPILATDESYVNLPVHQLDEIKAMLEDSAAVAAINAGQCGFTIEKFHQKRFDIDCYSAVWCDYNEGLSQCD